jgi:two-component system cell cycle sensor histidine kinase PleC
VPTIVRLNEKRYAAPGINLGELFDQIPAPIAYFDSDNCLGACNLSFRNAFPVVIESEFLTRASTALLCAKRGTLPSHSQSITTYNSARYALDVPDVRPTSDGGKLLIFDDLSTQQKTEAEHRMEVDALRAELIVAREAQHEAQSVARARKDFLTSTSHELRTPLNGILGFSEILATEMFGPLGNDRYREYAQIIHDSGQHVLKLINDLLDLAKLDAGKLELHLESIKILKVIIDCVRCVETQATRNHVGISVHVCEGIDRFPADDMRMHQMLLNLLSNALKFTPEGGEVSIEVFRRGEAIAIAVSDSGIGIRTEDIPAVLEPFGQVENELGRKHKGTGLGLPLTKELAELHGGSLTMESNMGFGTIVTILIPANTDSAMATAC